MPDNRFFRITDEVVDELRKRMTDQELIDGYARWAKLAPKVADLVRTIVDAFSGVELGNGIGLLEAAGIDDFASVEERRRLRAQDEKTDWRRISIDTLNRCYAAPSFLDARGFVFHLPAFLVAELNDQFHMGFIYLRLICDGVLAEGWRELLTVPQRDAIVATLKLVARHPEFSDRADEIAVALERYGHAPTTGA